MNATRYERMRKPMADFIFSNSTEIHFGRESQKEMGSLVKRYCVTNTVMIVSYAERVLGEILDEIEADIRAQGLDIVEFEGVVPNPLVSKAREGIKLAREKDVGMVIGVGGGSCVDTAKAIAAGCRFDGDIWDLYTGAQPGEILPVGAVMTLAGTGSETSIYAVLTNEETTEKIGFGDEGVRPRFAILNPEYTYSVNPWQTACGACDMFAHVLDAYLGRGVDEMPLTQRLSEGVMKTVRQYAPMVLADPKNYEARAQLMLSGTLAMGKYVAMGFEANLGLHTMAEDLGAVYNVTHGAALSALIPAWLTYLIPQRSNLLVRYANEVWGVEVDSADLQKTVETGIEKTRAFFVSLGLPVTLKELGIDFVKDGRKLADRITCAEDFGEVYVDILPDDVYEIYKIAQ